MDEMDLEQPVQPEEPAKAEATTVEQPVQAAPVAQESQAAATEEKPKWVKIVELVSIICIAAAGLLSALFMCMLSYKEVVYDFLGDATSKSYMFTDVVKSLKDAVAGLAEDFTNAAESGAGEGLFGSAVEVMEQLLSSLFLMVFMIMGMVTGIVLGIMLIVKTIKFALKKETALEKTAITSCLFFFSTAIIVLNMAMVYAKYEGEVEGINQYGAATLAGLIIVGILFAVYFVGKTVANHKMYLGDKTKLINGCFNLGWAVVAMLVLALLSCAPVMASADGGVYGYGFNKVFSTACGNFLKNADNISEEALKSFSNQLGYSMIGMFIFVWFAFQSGKSLHGAMRGVASGEKAVKLGSQIWRLIFAVLYLIICVVLAKEVFPAESEMKVSIAVPVVILVFSVIGLVLAIVNKVLVKEKAEKKEV